MKKALTIIELLISSLSKNERKAFNSLILDKNETHFNLLSKISQNQKFNISSFKKSDIEGAKKWIIKFKFFFLDEYCLDIFHENEVLARSGVLNSTLNKKKSLDLLILENNLKHSVNREGKYDLVFEIEEGKYYLSKLKLAIVHKKLKVVNSIPLTSEDLDCIERLSKNIMELEFYLILYRTFILETFNNKFNLIDFWDRNNSLLSKNSSIEMLYWIFHYTSHIELKNYISSSQFIEYLLYFTNDKNKDKFILSDSAIIFYTFLELYRHNASEKEILKRILYFESYQSQIIYSQWIETIKSLHHIFYGDPTEALRIINKIEFKDRDLEIHAKIFEIWANMKLKRIKRVETLVHNLYKFISRKTVFAPYKSFFVNYLSLIRKVILHRFNQKALSKQYEEISKTDVKYLRDNNQLINFISILQNEKY